MITNKLYYENQYLKKFYADILDIIERDSEYHVVLDKTAFFPGGGGQFCDIGCIEGIQVKKTYEKEGIIYHILDRKPNDFKKIMCEINCKRREDGMHQHFAQHVLSGCFFKLYGANTLGFHLGEKHSTVDIIGNLSEEEVRKVELYANKIVLDNVEAQFFCPSKEDLKKMKLRRKLPDTKEEIRIVKIGDLDINACCGVHPNYTGELKLIKIIKYEKYKENTRIEFLAGKRAIEYVLHRDACLTDVCRYLSCGEKELKKRVVNLENELDKILSAKKKLDTLFLKNEIEDLKLNSTLVNDIYIYQKMYDNVDEDNIFKIAKEISSLDNIIAILTLKNDCGVRFILVRSSSIKLDIDLGDILKNGLYIVDGKGGGSSIYAQGFSKDQRNIDKFVEFSFENIKKIINIQTE